MVGNRWERGDRDQVEIEVEARPLPDRRVTDDIVPDAETARSVDGARRAARVLRVVAWLIPAVSVLGDVLTSFWIDDQGMPGMSVRQRIGDFLGFVWVPLALAALVYAASFALSLYASRVELDATRIEGSTDR